MKLEDILQTLEKSAGFEEMIEAKKEAKDDKKDDKKKDSDKSDDKSKDKSEDKKDDKDQEKSASFKSGADLAKEIMEKVAAQTIEKTKGEEMNKQASDAGKALAAALIEKLAGVGDQTTENGIPAGVVPNKTQVDIAQQKAEHDQSFQATPGTDGAGNGGTINEIFDAIVADAAAHGASIQASDGPQAGAEGAANRQAPAQVQVDESQEKMAAAIALVNSGIDFDTAIDLVKAASDELSYEHDEQVKQAAFDELIDAGVDFDLAAALVKEASRLTAAKQAVGAAYGTAHAYGKAGLEAAKATGSNMAARLKGAPAAAKQFAKDTSLSAQGKLNSLKARAAVAGITAKEHVSANRGAYIAGAAGVGGAAAGAGAGYLVGREKKAALDALVDAGVDFDSAMDLVNSKSQELYGM
jgi:hypothetical protein